MRNFASLILAFLAIIIIAVIFNLSAWQLPDDVTATDNVPCFNSFEKLLLNKYPNELHLDTIFNCFEWDSLSICGRGSYKNHMDIPYKVIREETMKEYHRLDGLDGDESWNYIFFYKGNTIVSQAIAVPEIYMQTDYLRSIGWLGKKIHKSATVFIVKEGNVLIPKLYPTGKSVSFVPNF